jgi:predicted Rossmann fold flavoprotein
VNKDIYDKVWDVAVIGGGPAGMMAAGRAAERGLSVILFEKNEKLGKKLLITGGGRCNVTNAEFDTRKLLDKFKDSNKYLFSSFSQFAVQDTFDFFQGKNMPMKIEAEKRAFPLSNKSQSVWDVLVEYLKQTNVTVVSKSPVTKLVKSIRTGNDHIEEKIESVVLKNKKIITAKNFIVATGGKSRPETGSTGDGFEWLKELGHTVSDTDAALVPITISDEWVKRLQGVALQDIKLTLLQNNEKQDVRLGKILFTHFGVSGPTVLNMSKDISELLKYGEVILSLDLLPSLDYGQLNLKLQEIFKDTANKKFKNSLTELVTPAVAPIIVELSGIDPEKQTNSVTREERLNLVKILKHLTMNVSGLLGLEKAIITSGGVSLDEVDFKTMQSRKFPNLYLIGDILNIDRPSGGYSLQLCWTTGYVAGNSVANNA